MRQRVRVDRRETAGLYVRVSLDRVAHGMAEEILSPETQEARARAYCDAQGWQVGDVQRDIDESGYRQHYSHRPGLMRLLRAVEHGELTKIVVWKFSRLSRRLREFVEICDRVEAAGAGMVSVTEQIDTSTPAGRLIRNILASFAQFQSEELSEQISANWLTKVRRGERPAGQAPFGTRNERGILVPDPGTHHHLFAMFRIFADTNSLRQVHDYLVQNAVPPPLSTRWNLNTVRLILRNPVYIGQLEWLGTRYDAKWGALVPVHLWEEAQTLFASRRRTEVPRKDARMLSGLIRCASCGRTMWVKLRALQARSTTASGRVYQCLAPENLGKGCPIPALDAGEAEDAVWTAVERLLAACDVAAAVEAVLEQGVGPKQDGRESRAALASERGRVERASARLFDLLEDGSITQEQFRRQNQEYLRRIEAIDAHLADLESSLLLPDPDAIQRAARMAPSAATAGEKRTVLIALGARVQVNERRVMLDLLDLRINLRPRLLGDVFHFGEHYHRLDYRGPVLTDKQKEFMLRTYRWASKAELAARLGRAYRTVVTRARALGAAKVRTEGHSTERDPANG